MTERKTLVLKISLAAASYHLCSYLDGFLSSFLSESSCNCLSPFNYYRFDPLFLSPRDQLEAGSAPQCLYFFCFCLPQGRDLHEAALQESKGTCMFFSMSHSFRSFWRVWKHPSP
ncbi:hypothetical protein D8B26_004235 [Coccidioides posadasii str. Silveira]|uniref:uncharacterized protein n=1 Tax=Coccidioides posadasii (strain RMSCC 757 / Silveira) TaxID=443226 RepID=UPI001BF104FE|nr:hypothetical protein D8B26_004235 [Coccidioides posadasii str. Silveira]